MVEIIESHHYTKRSKKLLSKRDRKNIREVLSLDPVNGALIKGTGGLRKMRYALPGKGKSGGVRVIHFFETQEGIVVLLDVYSKSKQEVLTRKEEKALQRYLTDILRSLKDDE